MRKQLQLAGLVVCLVAGILLATSSVGSVQAAGTTTAETTPAEPTTVFSTETVEQTTTRQIILPATTTTSTSSSSSETPAWVWVLLAILAVALIIVIAILALRGGGGSSAISPTERRRRLDGAVASWTAQGWALESQSADSAVLQRTGERMIVSVDPAGQLSTRPYS